MTRSLEIQENGGQIGPIGLVFLVEWDKLHPNKGQCRTGDTFTESGTVPLKAGQLDSLLRSNIGVWSLLPNLHSNQVHNKVPHLLTHQYVCAVEVDSCTFSNYQTWQQT